MDPIVVRRHADRWSVQEGSETAPLQEYETRQLAEMAARDLAGRSGRRIVVHDDSDEPHGSEDRSDQGPADDRRTGPEPGIGVPGDETPREPQAGL